MERDDRPTGAPWPPDASDTGRDVRRDPGDEPPPAWRDAPPNPLTPIDPGAPVSGHVPAPATRPSIAESPEQDWGAAADRIFPLLRPPGAAGLRVEGLDPRALAAEGLRSHAQPLVDEGPAGLSVVYAIAAGGFDVLVNADHLLSWGVGTAEIQDAAIRNLAGWSAAAPWAEERSGVRRLISSQSGEGWDASRVLLPEVREHLARELAPDGRVLIGLPERHLLVAGTLRSDDQEFATLFADFVLESSGEADEPIDRRVFELIDGSLVPLAEP